ncbi:MAG: Nif3-like dinuclear metal center hexameric protein [Oscillospiraceae bacterium]|nr:Nif3-like dinuclear metal center hexameric protein [Oscillospiraceae bacterium]
MMVSVRDIYKFLDSFAPFSSADSWDNSGILIGSQDSVSDTVLITLDVTDSAIDKAVELGAKIIISHHPVIFHPLSSVSSDSVVAKALLNGISVISSHTCLDYASGGINDVLADTLSLSNIRGFDYDLSPLPLGRIGFLPSPMPKSDFIEFVKDRLSCPFVRAAGSVDSVFSVAVSGGSLASSPLKAVSLGADALISGDIKHDVFSSLPSSGILLIDAGHFYTENVIVPHLASKLSSAFPFAHFFPFVSDAPFSFL